VSLAEQVGESLLLRKLILGIQAQVRGKSLTGLIINYRKWWMSEKTPRTEMDEIEAAFAIINLQSDNLGKPIYLW
jgi:hypothetical protein